VLTLFDSNIKVDATTTTCKFAENVFYEYWRATQSDDGSTIEAYSPAARRSYELQCSRQTLITCRAVDGSHVTFPGGAVDEYDADQARGYACSHDLGPSDSDTCSDGGRNGGDHSSGRSRDDCDPSYTGACLDPTAIDYDCAGGTGDGPEYTSRVEVIGDDHYGLDRDGDGTGCDASEALITTRQRITSPKALRPRTSDREAEALVTAPTERLATPSGDRARVPTTAESDKSGVRRVIRSRSRSGPLSCYDQLIPA
jgi:hypothetical protein